jgi:hypothetical protein
LPAVLMIRRPAATRAVPGICAVLLAIGALVLLFATGAYAWWGLAIAHGTAWSVAWAAQLNDRSTLSNGTAAALVGAILNALFVASIGLAINTIGIQAISGLHIALGLTATLVLAWPFIPLRRAHHPV